MVILAGPMVAVTMFQFLLQVISLICLAGAALATSLTGVTGFSLLVSLPTSYILHSYIHTNPTVQIVCLRLMDDATKLIGTILS